MTTDAPDSAPHWPQVGVGISIIRDDGADSELLLVKRGRPPRFGQWSLPGGRQEPGETVFETAIREALEETATIIRPLEIVTVVDSITRTEKGSIAYHYTLVEVLAAWQSGNAVAGDDALDIAWVKASAVADWLAWETAVDVVNRAVTLWSDIRSRSTGTG